MKADVTCETVGCGKEHDVINTVTFPMEEEDAFFEAFGHGSEDAEDFCPDCGRLGVLQEPELEEGEIKEFINQARMLYAYGSDDNVEIDDDAKTSLSDERNGIWVQAWVWVPIEKDEEDK